MKKKDESVQSLNFRPESVADGNDEETLANPVSGGDGGHVGGGKFVPSHNIFDRHIINAVNRKTAPKGS